MYDIDMFGPKFNQEPKDTAREALDAGLMGWNIRCNRCGKWGADWCADQRPRWGALALCSQHRADLVAEIERHEAAMRKLRMVNFEQDHAAGHAAITERRREHNEPRNARDRARRARNREARNIGASAA